MLSVATDLNPNGRVFRLTFHARFIPVSYPLHRFHAPGSFCMSGAMLHLGNPQRSTVVILLRGNVIGKAVRAILLHLGNPQKSFC